MRTFDVKLPCDLVEAANWGNADVSEEAARLPALELYREDKVSLGRAAEICHTPIATFMDFAAKHGVPPCAIALRNSKKSAGQLMSSARDGRCGFITPHENQAPAPHLLKNRPAIKAGQSVADGPLRSWNVAAD